MTLTDYTQLKKQIVLNAGTHQQYEATLESVKDIFKHKINSPRRFEQTKSMSQLLDILELRDCLSENNVKPLKLIAKEFLKNKDLLQKIHVYEDNHFSKGLVNVYEQQNNCSLHQDINKSFMSSNPYMAVMSEQKKARIFNKIIEEIGSFWRNLSRYLSIREGDIEEIENTYLNLPVRARKMLEKYESTADPQRWFFVLCEALEKAQRKDLSRQIQEIMTMNI